MGHHGNSFLSFGGVPPVGDVGGWVEIGRTTLGGTSANILVSSVAAKRYNMVLHSYQLSANATSLTRLGNSSIDTGTNYASRQSLNGATDGALGTRSNLDWIGDDTANAQSFSVQHLTNFSSAEKLSQSYRTDDNGVTGAANAPFRNETAGKWVNTSNSWDEFEQRTASGTYASGGELVILGWDPADTHTNNFWEELASVTASGSSGTISSGTIPARKYLWIQAYLDGGGVDIGGTALTFNDDGAGNYANRQSANGGADVTTVNQTAIQPISVVNQQPNFHNVFIINNSANEKLVITHTASQGNPGAETSPGRRETSSKWANTANQITKIDFDTLDPVNWTSNSIFKVWGSD